jgi:dolichol-phosphate mannosyltransferase
VGTKPSEPIAVSVVIPCYNESAVLPLLRRRLTGALEALASAWEVVLVNDGSGDSTGEELAKLNREDARFKVVSLSRNFGHQAAISAGLHFASGDAVAVMDADLQDPPEILSGCLELLRAGHDVVYAVRRKRKENLLKRAAYQSFYRILGMVAEVRIPLDAGDFCMMNRRVVDVLKTLPERNVFMRGMRAWVGFRQIALEYERDARAAGETKYPFTKLCRLAADGLFSFSTAPLRLAIYAGFVVLLLSLTGAALVVIWRVGDFRFMGHTAEELPGWASAVAAVLFLNGIQLMILGLIGEYIGRIYSEVKQRPRWVIRETLGLSGNGTKDGPAGLQEVSIDRDAPRK